MYPLANQSKVPYLADLAKTNNYRYIALTETHLREGVRDAEVNIENYTLFRTNKKMRSHGGVALYIRNDLTFRARIIMQESDEEIETLAVHLENIQQALVVLYLHQEQKQQVSMQL